MADNPPVTPSPQSSPDGNRETRESQSERGYTAQETTALLRIMERILPLGRLLWQKVTDEYNEMFPEYPRTTKSLSDQYKRMLALSLPDPMADRVFSMLLRWRSQHSGIAACA
jgi:hypothetical protein